MSPRTPRRLSLAATADAIGLSERAFRRWIRRNPDLPVLGRGRQGQPWEFDPEAVRSFIAGRRMAEGTANSPHDFTSPTARLLLARAQEAEDRLAASRARLVHVAALAAALSRLWPKIEAFTLALPAAWGGRHNLPPAVVRDMNEDAQAGLDALGRRLQAALGQPVGSRSAPASPGGAF